MKTRSKGLVYAILSISLLTVMAGAAMAPALGAVSEHFAHCRPMTIQFIVSLPAVFIIITNFMFRPFCRLMKSRTLALVGLAVYVVAGAGAFFADNIVVLLTMRALLGVGVGMIMPLSTGLLTFYFPPEEQSRLMGLAAAMNQLGGVVATMLAGMLAAVQWNYAFLVYLAGLISVVLVVAFLPNSSLIEPQSSVVSSARARRAERMRFARSLTRFHPSVTSMFLVMTIFFIYPTNFALTAQSAGIDTLTTTVVMVALDVVAFVMGLCFARLMGAMPRGVKYLAPIFFLAGYAVLAPSTQLGGMLLGSLLIGLANGVGVPYINTIAGIKGGRDAATTVMPLISAALYLGQFLSPLIVRPLTDAFGGCSPYVIASAIAAIYLIQTILTRKHHALPPR